MENIKAIFQPITDVILQMFAFVGDCINRLIEMFMKFYNSAFVQENVLNFVLVVLLLIYICKSLKVSEKLSLAQQKVKETIENAKKTKEDSIKELLDANEKVQNIKEELLDIENSCEKNIENLKDKSQKETDSQIENLKLVTEKIIETENQQIVSELKQKTAIAALELAKEHIKRIIKAKPQYHQKFIEESIQELESGIKIK